MLACRWLLARVPSSQFGFGLIDETRRTSLPTPSLPFCFCRRAMGNNIHPILVRTLQARGPRTQHAGQFWLLVEMLLCTTTA